MGEGGCRVSCFFPHEDILTFPVPVLNVANLCLFSSTVNKQITPENCEEKKPPVHINGLNSSVLCPCVYTQSQAGAGDRHTPQQDETLWTIIVPPYRNRDKTSQDGRVVFLCIIRSKTEEEPARGGRTLSGNVAFRPQYIELCTMVQFSRMQYIDLIRSLSFCCWAGLSCQVMPRRAGDVESMYADPSLAKSMLGWTAKRNLKDMCNDTWRWQSAHPNGYK